jgi:xylulokinase
MDEHKASGNKYILAVDLGTSGPKVALISTQGELLDYAFEETPLILLPNGGAEQDPDAWWQSTLRAARAVLSKGLVPIRDVIAISCTAQWSGTVAVDRDGRHLMNAVIWMDSRGSAHIEKITGGIIRIAGYDLFKLVKWLRLTGGIPEKSGKGPLAHILFIKHTLPEVYKKTYKFLEPKDYLNLRLTGEFAASFDSIALHWLTDNRDISRVRYDEGLMGLAGIEGEKLPELRRAVDVLGSLRPDVADELGLGRDVQVITGTPDLTSAAIGSGAVGDFEGHLYIGTSSWLTCHVPFKKTDILHNMASLPSAIPERYFVANEQETAGACLNYLRDNILYHKDELLAEARVPDVYKVFDRIVENVPPGSDKVIFTPWLYGERTPIEDHTIRAGLYNQSLRTTREHVVRAVFEGVAFNARWLLQYVEQFIGRRLDPINMIGGGANSNVWCQIHADILNRTMKQVKDPIKANLRGAAYLASVALGHLDFPDIPDRVEIQNIFTPNPDHRGLYDMLFREYLNIYKQNKKIYARLNRARPG